MFRIEDLKAGEFIDLENYYIEISNGLSKEDTDQNELSETITKFFKLLIGGLPKSDEKYKEIILEFEKQMLEIKDTYVWIYNPPQLPSSAEENKPSKADGLKEEFAEDYGGYIEIIYLLCGFQSTTTKEVLEMPTKDFLFWGEYALRKRIIENVK